MATGQVVTNVGRKIAMRRCFETTVSLTAPNWFSVGTGTTTPTTADTAMETLVQISGSDTKAVASGYPTFDDTNRVATTRCVLLTTEANGSSLTEFGLLNNDGTPLLFSHLVHTAITKTTSVQVIYVEKDIVT